MNQTRGEKNIQSDYMVPISDLATRRATQNTAKPADAHSSPSKRTHSIPSLLSKNLAFRSFQSSQITRNTKESKSFLKSASKRLGDVSHQTKANVPEVGTSAWRSKGRSKRSQTSRLYEHWANWGSRVSLVGSTGGLWIGDGEES
ncbi:hypothetical protein PVAP13_1NG276238 [Panicum virgatum]|uniref:Uncharacterized protein n=1 Tax=Panicum virgatum TaxID=38727 RepID=A0A8T0WVB9_PANVG|nr:hypothetical protein PVAP13_1NG276238 [Panicum virgatum]